MMMRSVSSNLAFILLLLVHILAPLLHVHTSGNTGNGVLHVPGLESLYLAHGKTSVQAPHAEQADGMVVGIAQGLRQPFDTGIAFASLHDAILHDLLPVPPIVLSGRLQAGAQHQAVIHDGIKLAPPARAPPA
jgi:hypothetical protein